MDLMSTLTPGLVVLATALAAAWLLEAELRRETGQAGARAAFVARAVAYAAASCAAYSALVALGAPPAEAAMAAGALACLAALAEADLRWLLLPNRLVLLTGAQAGWTLSAAWTAQDLGPIGIAAAGALVGGGLLWGVRAGFRRLRGKEGLGLGDVKLAAALGLLIGPLGIVNAIAAGAMGLLGVALLFQPGRRPAGPQAASGALGEALPLGAGLAVSGFLVAAWTALQP